MYLFDICERLFARRSPMLAEQFRNALRAAKDRTSMLDVGEAMFDEVALAAGSERAASLREKFEQLLPLEAPAALA
jgi:methylphosphotriester-DNA--protein-cysteine methyltransferase